MAQSRNTTCLPAWDRSFGPRVDMDCRSFDFTLQFEDIVLACIPAATFLFLLPWSILMLWKNTTRWTVHSKLRISKLVAIGAIFVIQLVFLILRARDNIFKTNASIAADILCLMATIGVGILSFLDHQRSLRPSTLLTLYFSQSAVLGIARTRTLWLIRPSAPEPVVMTTMLSLTLIALVFESVEKKPTSKGSQRPAQWKQYSPEQYSGLWGRTSFAWLVATLRVGYSRVISVSDLPPLDTQLQANILRQKLMCTWATYNRQQRHSLLRACFHAYIRSFSSAIIPRLCLTAFTFAQPFMIHTTVTFVSEATTDGNYGKGLIGAWALVYLGIATSTAIYRYQLYRFMTRVRGGLTSLVYQRSLQIRTVDSEDITAVSLMGTDIPRIIESFRAIHEVWATLVDMAIAVWLLERQLSVACIAPVVVAIIFIAITSKLAASTKREQRRWIEKVQERICITTAILNDMKSVKMLGLSNIVSKVIQNMRKNEIQTSKGYRVLLTVRLVLSNAIINIAPGITFGVYVIVAIFWKDATLLTAQAFTSIALINLLTMPVLVFIQSLPAIMQCVGSFDRIQEYANYYTEKPEPRRETHSSESMISLQSIASEAFGTHTRSPEKQSISLKGEGFGWNKSQPAVLQNIDIRIEPESLTVIIGPVGSGKSSLLQSIMGETLSSSASSRKEMGPIACCFQEPWLENRTIRENIIGVSPYDPKWYETVKLACGLDQDFSQIEKGDQATVGSRGSSLSGGQKQRITLARAVYSRCPVVLLDDVFSGMDARTIEHTSSALMGRNGLFRKHRVTVVLATHNSKMMALADTIITLEGGKVVGTGSPVDLLGIDDHVDRVELTLRHEAMEGEDLDEINTDSTNQELRVHEESNEEAPTTHDDARRKSGDPAVYKYYCESSGWIIVILFIASLALGTFCTEFPTIWLKWWSDANTSQPNKDVGMYIGVYILFGAVGTAMIFSICWLLFIKIISNTGHKLHSDLLEAVLKAPFHFFIVTDTGSLINRFSQDMELIDMELPNFVVNYTYGIIYLAAAFDCFAKLIILVIFSEYLAAAAPLVGTVVYFLQRFYLQTSRQVRLLGIEAKAPLYTSFQESVVGAPTIRAFGWQMRYQERNDRLINTSQRPEYLQYCIQQWLTFTLDIIITVVVVILLTIVVTLKDKFDPGSVGVSLTAVVSFSTILARVIQMWTAMESSIGAVSRIKQFVAETDSEDRGQGHASTSIPVKWPHAGAVDISNITASHRPGLDPVLKDISLSVKPSEHIAICGRSGSGKTSLILCLLDMLVIQNGSITIDSISVSSLSPLDLRSNFNVVSQDPFLLPGSIRFNMDPFGEASDAGIIHALERVGLWKLIRDGDLSEEMNSETWSAGQRQLLCLARAIVRQKKLIIFDEATSSVDADTERVIQEIVDSEFKSCTVLAVMHRLQHVTKYDRVALLDSGTLIEYDEPSKLLRGDTKFRELYESHK